MKINIVGKSKKDLAKYLVDNKQDIIDLKKSATKFTDVYNTLVPTFKIAGSALDKSYAYSNNLDEGIVTRTIVANTYNWLDSHDDVHLPNLFAKSINERVNRIPHLHDHKRELQAKVGKVIGIREASIKWSELGVDMKGNTMALLMESDIKKSYNEKVYEAYLHNEIDQHSVGMQYVKVDLALNDEDYKDEFKVWKAYIDQIGNADKAVEQGYFFAVREAKLIEVSAVLFGANELTPTLGETKLEESLQPLLNKLQLFIDNNTAIKDKKSLNNTSISAEKLLTFYKI